MPMEISGMEGVIRQFSGMADAVEPAARKAVKAGANIAVDHLKEAAPVYAGPHKDVTPGALRDSIKAKAVSYSTTDGYSSKVTPDGTDHGENLAKIGNILEYGRSNMPAKPWFFNTLAGCESEVTGEMERVFKAEVQKK